MSFSTDRIGRKKKGQRITAQRHDELIAAIRASPADLESVAARFDLGMDVVRRYAGFAR